MTFNVSLYPRQFRDLNNTNFGTGQIHRDVTLTVRIRDTLTGPN